jgi:hypothetical protein
LNFPENLISEAAEAAEDDVVVNLVSRHVMMMITNESVPWNGGSPSGCSAGYY